MRAVVVAATAACWATLALANVGGADEYYEESHPPETTITKQPRNTLKTKLGQKRKSIVYEHVSSVAGSTFTCTLDGKASPCTSRFRKRVRIGKHTFAVAATSPAGTADPTPATDTFKVKRRRR